jgi:hypothetical protein
VPFPRYTFSSSPTCRLTVLPLSASETEVEPAGAGVVALAAGRGDRPGLDEAAGPGVTSRPGPLAARPVVAPATGEAAVAGLEACRGVNVAVAVAGRDGGDASGARLGNELAGKAAEGWVKLCAPGAAGPPHAVERSSRSRVAGRMRWLCIRSVWPGGTGIGRDLCRDLNQPAHPFGYPDYRVLLPPGAFPFRTAHVVLKVTTSGRPVYLDGVAVSAR